LKKYEGADTRPIVNGEFLDVEDASGEDFPVHMGDSVFSGIKGPAVLK